MGAPHCFRTILLDRSGGARPTFVCQRRGDACWISLSQMPGRKVPLMSRVPTNLRDLRGRVPGGRDGPKLVQRLRWWVRGGTLQEMRMGQWCQLVQGMHGWILSRPDDEQVRVVWHPDERVKLCQVLHWMVWSMQWWLHVQRIYTRRQTPKGVLKVQWRYEVLQAMHYIRRLRSMHGKQGKKRRGRKMQGLSSSVGPERVFRFLWVSPLYQCFRRKQVPNLRRDDSRLQEMPVHWRKTRRK